MHSLGGFPRLGEARTHELEKPHSTESQGVAAVTAGAVWDWGWFLMPWLRALPADKQG